MTLEEILLKAHSGIRWLVLLAMVVGVFGLLRGWWRTAQYQQERRVWGLVYSVLLDLQLVLGALLFFMLSAWWNLAHPITMVLAVGCAHVGTILGRLPPERANPSLQMLAYALSYLFILLGLASVPRGFGF
ncbi:hypothetical protein LM602_08460 [Candidatus Acetothermia bacterium]|jgi:uncharacterized membrane protein HdeD (DUF308 family)|nr:hypothetical protein [Candidatus Acetothermia bacterium]MCI2432556.1 hypothetical protein [Candidatus Acetothermia bacterium]MCI2435867.1 hypothetical protein [Candidatus Acetothermia bacterium]